MVIKKTIKHSAIYGIGVVARRLTGLVMLPIYTRYLSPADYGIVALLGIAIELMAILVGRRISQALFRYYILAPDEDEKYMIVSTAMITVMVTSSIGVLILYIGGELLSQIIFGSIEYAYELRIFSFTLLTNAIIAVGLSYLRARQKPVFFVVVNMISLVLQVAMNIYFVVILEMHVTGVVIASLLSSLFIAIGLCLHVFASVGTGFSYDIFAKLMKFLMPLIVASLGGFYVGYADKYFIRQFVGLADVGLYVLAGSVSAIMMMVFEVFNTSWSANRLEVVKEVNAKVVYEKVFRYLNVVLIFIGVCLAMFANDLFRVMTTPDFYSASYLVPILVISALFSAYSVFCNLGSILSERTKIIAEATWVKAFVASIGYFTLIPYLGAYGAALTLATSQVIAFMWIYLKSRAQYDMGLNWQPIILMIILAVICVTCGLMLPEGEIVGFALRVLIVVFFSMLLYIIPIWSGDERALMKATVISLVRDKFRRK